MTEMSLDTILEGPRVRDYIALLKPKVMSLVVFTAFVGLYLAPGFEDMHPIIAVAAILCIAVGAGAAGAINMWYDRDIDAIMTRTKNRPIPSGRVQASEALSFGVVLGFFAVFTMALTVNYLSAALLALSILFYVFIYTVWLKRATPQNIVIGGAAGAFPPMIGWAAASGDITLASLSLFALIFFWTPPHFWALALFMNDDYARAGVPMMPVVRGVPATKMQMLVYTIILLPLSIAPTLLGATGWIYAFAALLLSGIFIVSALRVRATDDLKPARSMFGFSVLYLFVLFALMMIDKA